MLPFFCNLLKQIKLYVCMYVREKLTSLTNYCYVIGYRANNRQRVIGAFCNFHVNSKQRETNGVRV